MSESFRERLREAERFFAGRGKVHRTLRRITTRLAGEGIPYAVIGDMAMNAHGYQCVTTDVDILITREGLDELPTRVAGRDFQPWSPGARKKLRDTTTGIDVEFITTGEYPGDGLPKPVAFPDPRDVSIDIGGMNVIRLEKLIELKLVSGALPQRRRDHADVQDLITRLRLPRTIGEQIDPSVRDLYHQIWDQSQNTWDPSAD